MTIMSTLLIVPDSKFTAVTEDFKSSCMWLASQALQLCLIQFFQARPVVIFHCIVLDLKYCVVNLF